jgi:hypothetical protein
MYYIAPPIDEYLIYSKHVEDDYLIKLREKSAPIRSLVWQIYQILPGMSFIHIMNNIGPTIDPWENPSFNVPYSEKTF